MGNSNSSSDKAAKAATSQPVAETTTNTTTNTKIDNDNEVPCVYVICGPSGVGKGTLLKELYSQLPNCLSTAVSTTTRKARKGEINGKHYHFTDVSTFEQMISNNEFLEYAKVHNNYYGTSKAAIKDVCDSDKLCILEIDRIGAINVSKDKIYGANAKFLFVTTHDTENVNEVIATLRERLKGRNSETEEQINTRMKTAEAELIFFEEWKKLGKWDYIVCNDNLKEATERLKAKFMEWDPSIKQKLEDNNNK